MLSNTFTVQRTSDPQHSTPHPNPVQVYDFVNVESIHNESFYDTFPETLLLQARDLANFHEWILYTDPVRGGIGNSTFLPFSIIHSKQDTVDGYTILPSLLNALTQISSSSELKLHYSAISYKPFISLFNLTAADPIHNPITPTEDSFGGIVDYASAVVFEVHQDDSIKMLYKNGTKDFVEVALNGSLNSVSGFVSALTVSFSLLFRIIFDVYVATWD